MRCWVIARGYPKRKAWDPRRTEELMDYHYAGESMWITEPSAAVNFASRATAERLIEDIKRVIEEAEGPEEAAQHGQYRVLPRTGKVWTRRWRGADEDDWAVAVVAHIDEYHTWFALRWAEGEFDPVTEREAYGTAAQAKRELDRVFARDEDLKPGKWTTRDRTPWFSCRRGADVRSWWEGFDPMDDFAEEQRGRA